MERIRKSKSVGGVISVLLAAASLVATACQPSISPAEVSPSSTVSADKGNAIVAEYLQRDASAYRKERVRFSVTGDDGKTDIYEVDTSRRQQDGITTTLSVITKPAEDAGTASLAVQQPGTATKNITYSRSREDYRETDTGKMFFGGLTVQELLGEWDKYDFRVVNASAAGNELEGKLKPGERSVISVIRVRFDPEFNIPVEMTMLDSGGKELRRYSKAKISTADGRPYVSHIEVENPIYRSRIIIDILDREYPAKLDASLFTKEALKTAARR